METTANKPADMPRVAAACARSRVTNGRTLLVGVDGRSKRARRYRDLLTDFVGRTNGRHADLCRALAAMCMERERLEAKMVAGEQIDTDMLVRLAGEIRRSCERVGIVTEADDGGGDPVANTAAALAALRTARKTEAA